MPAGEQNFVPASAASPLVNEMAAMGKSVSSAGDAQSSKTPDAVLDEAGRLEGIRRAYRDFQMESRFEQPIALPWWSYPAAAGAGVIAAKALFGGQLRGSGSLLGRFAGSAAERAGGELTGRLLSRKGDNGG